MGIRPDSDRIQTNGPHGSVLDRWGALAESLQRLDATPTSWDSAKSMIAAAQSDAERAEKSLKILLELSKVRFFPGLGDPLDLSLDLRTHRWLKLSREEAYSDWLAWIIERQTQAGRLLSLFQIHDAPSPNGAIAVEREVYADRGRLDLLIRLGATSTFVVEVKTSSSPDIEQLNRYLSWLHRQPGPIGKVVLLAPEPLDGDLPEHMSFCSWRRVAETLRCWSSQWLRQGRGIEAALTLAFCGAIEQNILGFGVEGLEALSTEHYLEEWMKEARSCPEGELTTNC